MRKLISLLFFICFSLIADEYELGQGYKLGSAPVYVGGYFSTDYEYKVEDNQNRFRIDDIAFLSYGSYEKFSYLAEFEFKEFYVVKWGKSSKHELNSQLHTERLYLNYDYDENLILRGGKFNSPIGYWNLTPINVLRDTTSSPYTNTMIFPKYTTGLNASASYYSDYELRYEALVQNNNDLDDTYNNYKIDKHFGGGIEYMADDLSLKFNGGYFHSKEAVVNSEDIYYLLSSFKYENNTFRVMGELGTQFSKEGSTTPYSLYVQGVYNLNERHFGILRFESYKSYDGEYLPKDNIAILGYTYRPLYPIAFKAEYQFHEVHKEDSVLFSFSVLF